ncbi:Pol [Symbiodinium microadriaticum]|nr:Pol [Symbiodinium microadriaticum]
MVAARKHRAGSGDLLRLDTPKSVLSAEHDSGRQRSTVRRTGTRAGSMPTLHCLSWNAGGLNAGVYQELVAWLEIQNKYQVCVVQETHWPASSEFYSGRWFCIQSAPPPDDVATDRYAGILVMLSRAYFQDPAVHEVIGGHVVHVRAACKRTGVNLDIVATYQHVWRSHLSTSDNTAYRDSVWDALDAVFGSLPTRNILLACGDYNTNLRPCQPHVGNAVGPATGASTLDQRLPQMLARHDLCALNSWHAHPAHTYYGPTGYSQIDYVLTRRSVAIGASRQAHPVHSFPVAGWRLAGHLPLEAQLPMLPIHWRPGRQSGQNQQLPINKARLLEAAATGNAEAAALQHLVAQKLQDLPADEPRDLHHRIDRILQQCVRQVFPPMQQTDTRISAQVPYRASARQTWHLYAQMRRPRVATIAAMLHKWKLQVAFARASRALRQQSRELKRAAFANKLLQAEAAAQRGDQRTLFQIVRSLAPSSGRIFSRLRDSEGAFLSRSAEAQALVEQGKATYAQHADRPLEDCLQATKAVPRHMAPAAAWKLCASSSSSIGPLFGESFRKHFTAGALGHLHGDLTDAQMVMLPKVGKSPHILENLKPIGLMGPPSKALAGALRNRMLEQLNQLVAHRPQFAYTAGRGTLNALLRVHMHVTEATALLRANHVSRFGLHAGRRPLALAGALSLSLDLSRAFDLADRCSIYNTLEKYQVPRAVVDVVQRLYTGSRFVYQAGAHTAAFVPTNGLKQGCKVAPCLWVWYTVALFDTLEERLSETWVQHTPTMFADDCWAHWLIKSASDFQQALRELQILLCTLEDYKMRINFTKTAVLLKLVGKQAKQALYDHTCLKQGVLHLVVLVHGRTQHIPIRVEHEYLGSKVSYHRAADCNLDHRLQSGQLRYHCIQKALAGRHAISQAHRIRLWAACVQTSMMYSLNAVGVTAQGLQRWETRVLKHLRAILRQPAHLTHVTNDAIWQRANLRRPGEQLLEQIRQARLKLETRASIKPDITTMGGAIQHLRDRETQLRLLLQGPNRVCSPPEPALPQFSCPHCEATFMTEHALNIHCGIKHPAPAGAPDRPIKKHVFDPALHSVGGLPHCRACGRKFTKWQFFKHHIEAGACSAVGGASFVHKPPVEVELREEVRPPTQPPPAHQAPPEQNLPLVQRPFFKASWSQWERLLSNAALRQELQAHCVLCHFWVADHQHIRQHQRRVHGEIIQRTNMPSDLTMNQDGSGLNPEADIFRYVRAGQRKAFGANAPGPHQDTIKTLTRVIIRQEDQLAELRGDKGFCLFLREEQEMSIIPALIQISKDWHARQEARDHTLKSPLRTLLMACLIRRLRELMILMTSTPESVKKLQAAEWMNQAEEWTFFKWSPVAQQVHEHLVQMIGVSALMLVGDWGCEHDARWGFFYWGGRVAPTGSSTWSSRALTPMGEELINCWHQQESLHALDVLPPWFFVQLPRLDQQEALIQRLITRNRGLSVPPALEVLKAPLKKPPPKGEVLKEEGGFKRYVKAGLNHVLSMCRVPDTAASMFQDFNSGKAQERYNEVCKEEQILQAVDHEMPLGQERYVAGIYQMPNPMKDRLFFWREWAALVPCEDGGELYISIAMTPSAEVSAASVIMGDVKGSMPKAVQNMVAGNASSYLINFRDAHSH